MAQGMQQAVPYLRRMARAVLQVQGSNAAALPHLCTLFTAAASATASLPPLRAGLTAAQQESLAAYGTQATGARQMGSTAVQSSRAGEQEQEPACVRVARGEKLRVAVALSGGVDSAVTALLLQRAGHDVFGVFMRNWDVREEGAGTDDTTTAGAARHGAAAAAQQDQAEGGAAHGPENQPRAARTCSEQDARDAAAVATTLGIPFHKVDFVRQYWQLVFTGFVAEYARGATPNPDLACNRAIKFGALLHAAQALGADAVATGHYANVRLAEDPSSSCGTSSNVVLTRGADPVKDQSYFLASVSQSTLRHYLLPLGGFKKAEVRSAAAAAGLSRVSNKRSSRGICFVGPRDFGTFMRQYVEPLPGVLVDVSSGSALGSHPDILALTTGQRVRAGHSLLPARGQQPPQPWYVVAKDMLHARVYVAAGLSHPALWVRSAAVGPVAWVAGAPPNALERAARALDQHCSSGQGRSGVAHNLGNASTANGQGLPALCSVLLRCQYKARHRQEQLGRCSLVAVPSGMWEGSRFCSLLPVQGTTSVKAEASGAHEATRASSLQDVRCSGSAGDTADWCLAPGWQLVVVFDTPERGIAPGQVLVLYEEESKSMHAAKGCSNSQGAEGDSITACGTHAGGRGARSMHPTTQHAVASSICLGAVVMLEPGPTGHELSVYD